MYKKKKRGQSAIEWGVLLPFLILIIASVLELSPLMSNIMVVDKATQYAASSAAKKGTDNLTITYNYLINMQGLIPFSAFLDTTHGLSVDPNKSQSQLKEEALQASTMSELFLKEHTETASKQNRVDGDLVVTPSSFTIQSWENQAMLEQLSIVPGVVTDRYSGSWVAVSAKHEYKILTPLLQAVLGGSCDTGGNKGIFIDICNYFPINKTTVYRVE